MKRPRRRLRTAALAAGALAALVSLTACGLPADGASHDIAAQDVPYGLTSPAPSATATVLGPGSLRETEPRTYLLNPAQQLVAVPTPIDLSATAPPQQQLEVLLKMLMAGPTERQRAAGLSTALTPGVVLQLVSLVDRTATLQLETATKEPPADRLPLGVGQIVLTATSVLGVGSVQLVQDGQPVEVPLPGGALTSAPLQRADYRELVAGPVANSTPAPTATTKTG